MTVAADELGNDVRSIGQRPTDELVELIANVPTLDGHPLTGTLSQSTIDGIAAALRANPDVVLRALGGSMTYGPPPKFNQWWSFSSPIDSAPSHSCSSPTCAINGITPDGVWPDTAPDDDHGIADARSRCLCSYNYATGVIERVQIGCERHHLGDSVWPETAGGDQ